MPIPSGLTKNVISGTLPGSEVWQTSYWQTGLTAAEADDAHMATLAANSTFIALMNAWKALCASGARATAIDRYYYAGGSGAAAHGHAALNYGGTATPQAGPNQVAVVTTLRTAVSSRAGRGRMYWPATGVAADQTTGLLANGNIDILVDALAAWFTALTTGQPAVVVSQTQNTSHPITSVDADYRADTQRRRVNKIRSLRHSHVV
jgi:hypothetical protein